jgi:hypothetical protein
VSPEQEEAVLMSRDAREALSEMPVAAKDTVKEHAGPSVLDLDAMVDQLEVRDSRGRVQSVVESATTSGDVTEFEVTDYLSKMDKTVSVIRVDETHWAITAVAREATDW